MIKKWKLLESQKVFESPFINLLKDKLERPDGRIVSDYYSVARRDVVYLVGLTSDKKIPLVYQYKNGVKDLLWELPAGFVEKGENPLESAQRELLEETGFTAPSAFLLGSFLVNAGTASSRNHLFFADKIEKKGEQTLDENEEIEVKLFDFEILVNDIKKRKSILLDVQSQFGLLLAWEKLNS